MKVRFFISCLSGLLFTGAAFGQASFELANSHFPLVDAPVFDSGGVPLAGSNYFAELWGAATPDSLTPLAILFEGNRREIVPFLGSGYFFSPASSLCVTSVPPSGFAWLQVRAWDARLGPTYEEVMARGLGGYGESAPFYLRGGNPYDLLGLPAPLTGLQSFNLRPVVPEPSALGLLLFGGLVLFCRQCQPRH